MPQKAMKPTKPVTHDIMSSLSSRTTFMPTDAACLLSRPQRRGSRTHSSRTTNACEACKKRKTKCSGPPGQCEACSKVNTFCHFNMKLDTRRKVAYKPTAMKERQQYILHALLQVLKHTDAGEVQSMIDLIRGEATPHVIAATFRKSIHALQKRSLIPGLDIDDADIVSLGLQGLYSHRGGRPGSRNNDEKGSDASHVPVPTPVATDFSLGNEVKLEYPARPGNYISRSNSDASSDGFILYNQNEFDMSSSASFSSSSANDRSGHDGLRNTHNFHSPAWIDTQRPMPPPQQPQTTLTQQHPLQSSSCAPHDRFLTTDAQLPLSIAPAHLDSYSMLPYTPIGMHPSYHAAAANSHANYDYEPYFDDRIGHDASFYSTPSTTINPAMRMVVVPSA